MIKFILILLLVLVVIGLWRANRPGTQKQTPRQPKDAPLALEMVRCRLCSLHLPAVEAVQGQKGVYCCSDHLHRAEP